MDPIYTFGAKLAELMKQKEFAGIGLLCLAIKDSGRGFENLTYEDFKDVFQTCLLERLQKMKVPNTQHIVMEMNELLIHNQSIFTLSSH